MNRDARGRFTTRQHADVEAAERLLERAVEEARRVMKVGVYRGQFSRLGEGVARRYHGVERDHVRLAERTMRAATESADLLMRRAG